MSIQRVAIKDFVSDLKAAEKRRDGYIMGSRGQDPKKWAKIRGGSLSTRARRKIRRCTGARTRSAYGTAMGWQRAYMKITRA